MSLYSSFLSHLLLLLLLSFSFLDHAHAQTPLATQGSSFASVKSKFFFISGGSLNATVSSISQTFKIDLSVTWNTANPAIATLDQGPAEDYVPGALLPDNQTFVLFSSTRPNIFDMLSGWKYNKAAIPNMTLVSDLTYFNAAAVDPSTGKVYVPNGITQKDTTGNEVRYMLEYDVATEASKALSQSNAGNLNALQDYAVVWSKSLNKLLAFGGRSNATTFNLNLYAYTPSAGQWQVLETTGSSPGGRAYFCMVPAYDGSKFVLLADMDPIQPSATTAMSMFWTFPTRPPLFGPWSPPISLRIIDGDHQLVLSTMTFLLPGAVVPMACL